MYIGAIVLGDMILLIIFTVLYPFKQKLTVIPQDRVKIDSLGREFTEVFLRYECDADNDSEALVIVLLVLKLDLLVTAFLLCVSYPKCEDSRHERQHFHSLCHL